MKLYDEKTMEEALAHSKQMMKQKAKEERRRYVQEHRFDIINSCLAVLALLVAILALFLPASG